MRQAFSFQPLLVGGNPFSTTSIYLLIHWLERKWGVHFPKGGTTAIVNGMGKLLEELGVDIRLNSPVTEINIARPSTNSGALGKADGVTLASGERIRADIVVANGDPLFIYKNLVAPEFRHVHSNWKLKLRRPSMGLFVSYFGTKKQYPHLAHHTIILGPRYKELLADIFKRRVLAHDFSLYLHAPTRTDANLAPEGGETFYVLSPVPNNLSGIDWREAGPRYQELIFDFLEKNHLPGLRENLVTSFFVTPDYFETELRSEAGAGFGLEPVFRQSAYFRFHNRSEDVDGLYFVGASTHPGAGVPGVLCSAKVLEKIVPRPPLLSPRPADFAGSLSS